MARTRNRTKTDAPAKDDAAESGADMTTEQRMAATENRELSVDDEVHANSDEENAKIVAAAVSKPNADEDEDSPEEAREPEKAKQLTTGQVAGEWVRMILEKSPATYTKKELHELALKGNTKRLNAKQIIEAKKVGQICPANKIGAYTPEGLAPDKNGGFEVVVDDDGKLSLKK